MEFGFFSGGERQDLVVKLGYEDFVVVVFELAEDVGEDGGGVGYSASVST